jgi:hypothetical protein
MSLKALTRAEFLSAVGLLKEIDPITDEAYKFVEQLERLKPSQGTAADSAWHLSFHGSQFPGNEPLACGRKMLYTMMDAPRRPIGRWLQQIADSGKDIEDRVVGKWYQAGYLVSAPPPPFGKLQTVYEDSEHWLTSTVDAEILPLRSNQIVVTEVKSKAAKVISKMQRMVQGPDPAHVKQLKTQIGLSREAGPRHLKRCYNTGRLAIKIGVRNNKSVIVCPQHGHSKCLHDVIIDPPNYGRLYYVSRDEPTNVKEFFYEFDPDFMEVGRNRLKSYQNNWIEGTLPQTHFSGKHPFGWNWTTRGSPCEWCDFGTKVGNRTCQEDHKKSVESGKLLKLQDSDAIHEAKLVRSDYSFDLIRVAVEKRWINSME